MTAAGVLELAAARGIALSRRGDRIRWRTRGEPPPTGFVATVRKLKPELLELLDEAPVEIAALPAASPELGRTVAGPTADRIDLARSSPWIWSLDDAGPIRLCSDKPPPSGAAAPYGSPVLRQRIDQALAAVESFNKGILDQLDDGEMGIRWSRLDGLVGELQHRGLAVWVRS